jgi:hypothetical protein
LLLILLNAHVDVFFILSISLSSDHSGKCVVVVGLAHMCGLGLVDGATFDLNLNLAERERVGITFVIRDEERRDTLYTCQIAFTKEGK